MQNVTLTALFHWCKRRGIPFHQTDQSIPMGFARAGSASLPSGALGVALVIVHGSASRDVLLGPFTSERALRKAAHCQ